jgi:transposase
MFSNADPRARKKCLIVYLRATGRPCHEIEDIARVDEDTVTNAVKKYVKSDLAGLLKENYRKPKSQLEPHNERLKALFEKQPPHTVNHAIDMILKKRGAPKTFRLPDVSEDDGHEMQALRLGSR